MKLSRHINRNVTLTGVQTLNNPTREERAKIKEALTFDNPAYAKAKRYSAYVSRISPYLHYFEEDKKSITVPLGFDLRPFLETRDLTSYDKRVVKNVVYPPFLLKLRETQEEAFHSYYATAGYKNAPRNIIQLPTGKGKTILGLQIAYALSQRTLIIVHKVDLLNGWKKDIQKAFGGKVQPHILQGTKNVSYGEHITITTIQTLNRLSEKDLEMLSTKFGLIIQDEMHHCPASSYSISLAFQAKYRLGLTATPERSDGLGHVMTLYYGDFAYKYKNKVNDKDILPVKVIPVTAPVYFDPICTQQTNGKWLIATDEDLKAGESTVLKKNQSRISNINLNYKPDLAYANIDNAVIQNEDLQRDVVKRITEEHKQGHSVVVFFSQKAHVKLFYDLLKPVLKDKVFTYYGDNSEKENERVLETAEKIRDTVTLTTYAKATEGTNVKQWEVEFLVSSINNGKNVEQAIGRIRRVADNKISPVRVYDYQYLYCYILRGHTYSRKERYRKMNCLGEQSTVSKSIFKRG